MECHTAIEAVAAIACARTVTRLDHKVRNNSVTRVEILSVLITRGPTYGRSLHHNNLRVVNEKRVRVIPGGKIPSKAKAMKFRHAFGHSYAQFQPRSHLFIGVY